MDEDSKEAALRVRDPLSEVSRRERRALLGVSFVAVAITYADLVPSQIRALGLTISEANEGALLLILALAVVYFLAAFAVYAYSDYVSWQVSLSEASIAATREREKFEEWLSRGAGPEDSDSKELAAAYRRRLGWWAAARGASRVRAVLEFVVPSVFGVFAVTSLLWSAA